MAIEVVASTTGSDTRVGQHSAPATVFVWRIREATGEMTKEMAVGAASLVELSRWHPKWPDVQLAPALFLGDLLPPRMMRRTFGEWRTIISSAALRAAMPVAFVTATMSPLRFSISTWPKRLSLASLPCPLR
jgi:hypothetical protein